MKAIKSEEEIGIMRATARLQDAVLRHVLSVARPGMRDVEVTAHARHAAELAGSEQSLFLASSAPMGTPALFASRHFQGRTIKPGDQLLLLVENTGLGGYYTELVRTIVFGRASNELREHFDVTRQAQAETLARLVPGASCSEIGVANDQFMTSRGRHPEPRLFGHGHGYDIVERPLLRFDETMPVAANMVFSIHPAYATETAYATVCDSFVVAADGTKERLHETPQEIFEVY
jgi:Xaa-Pro aminopeptidase